MTRRIGNKRHFVKPGTGTKFRLVNRSICDFTAGHNVLAPIQEHAKQSDIETTWDDSGVVKLKKAAKIPESFLEGECEPTEEYLRQLAENGQELPDWDPDVMALLEDEDAEIIENPSESAELDEDLEDFDSIARLGNISNDASDLDDYVKNQNSYVMEKFFGDGYGSVCAQNNNRCYDADDLYERISMGSAKKTNFTSYSMTSSIMRRNDKLESLDDQFEEMFITKYDEDNVGDLQQYDRNQYEIDSDTLMEMTERDYEEFAPQENDSLPCDPFLKESALRLAEMSDSVEVQEVSVEVDKPKWDCETIISTYSNIYNKPKIVDDGFSEISKCLKGKRGKNMNTKVNVSASLKEMEIQYQEERKVNVHKPQKRNKDETLEEKKLRKQATRENKKERRIEKKETSQAFKKEFSLLSKKISQEIHLH